MSEKPFPKVDQVGIVVEDMERAVQYYQSMGIGPFQPIKGVVHAERKVRGKIVYDIKNEARVAQIGSLQLELICPVEGNSLQKEFLVTKGEGINHIGCSVDDLDKEVAEMEKKGFKILSRSKFKGGGGAVYFDTTKIGGVIIEFVQWPPGYSKP